MTIPIVLSAFGTTTRALDTYAFMDRLIRRRFPDHDIRWAYSSRMVRDWIKMRRGIDLKHPHEVLNDLIAEGRDWAVVQSVHLMCGHEFNRLVAEVQGCAVRTSVGLPVLAAPSDYERLGQVMKDGFQQKEDEALVLVGHGTDHPSWSSYMAMNQMFAETIGPGAVHVGMIEGEYLSPEAVLDKVRAGRFHRVCLAPMMLVAGVHFQEDIDGTSDSWRAVFEAAGIEVRVENRGLGMLPAVSDLLADHIREAMDVIPDRVCDRQVRPDPKSDRSQPRQGS
ncbi:MAG: sirohydrochlorin cobaltochelatase [Thermodesulfobacteriota bacterium]